MGWQEAYGISCNSGKLTLLYAIKAAISKIAPEVNRQGIPTDLAIITNAGAHYSIEHACAFLGLGSDRFFRIPCDDTWQMQQDILADTIAHIHQQGLRVANATHLADYHGEALPLISIVPDYHAKPSLPTQTAFLIFPMRHTLDAEKVKRAVALLLGQINAFETAVLDGDLVLIDTQTQRPVR